MKKQIELAWRTVSGDAGMTLRDFLRKKKQLSRKLLAEVKFQGGGLYVNGAAADVKYILAAADRVKVIMPPEEISGNIVPNRISLEKLYEDDHVLVINKPPALPVLPMSDRKKPSLSGAVLYEYQKQGWPATVHIVTRLDRDTSGVMLIAKHRYAHSRLFSAQQAGEVMRSYAALTAGEFPWQFASVHAPISRKYGSIIEREVESSGQPAVTHIKRVSVEKGASLLFLSLKTGRTHQIRVHLSWLGHPIIGDTLYGSLKGGYPFQALHAKEIAFPHPITSEKIVIRAPVPFL